MADTNGSSSNGNEPAEIDIDPALFQNLADLEKRFAKVELDIMRRKEFALRPLYTKRNTILSQIPNFWPLVLMHGPQEFQSALGPADEDTIMAIKSLTVERYAIKSETEGEPRSTRFTFEFGENEWFEDTKVVKEFEFVEQRGDGDDDDGTVNGGYLVSKPVTFKWKKKGKKGNHGFLDLAVELYQAEEAVRLKDEKSGKDLRVVDRKGLWQYEKLRDRLEKAEDDDGIESSWLDWFGFRGPVERSSSDSNGHNDGESEDGEDGNGMLDVELFPAGEEVAIALSDDLWPNVMDYFMASQQEPIDDFDGLDSDEEVSEDEADEVPDLVEATDVRPAKRQKR